jgi:hypothetical protein
MNIVGIESFANLCSLEPDEAAVKGTLTILGVSHHAWFIRVKEVGDGIEAVHDPYGRFDEVVAQSGEGNLETVCLPGFPGEYALAIYPFAR